MQDPNTILNPGLWSLRDAFRAKGFDLRLVGGCVRDLLMGLTPKDVDLHTDATPEECVSIYTQAGVRFELTGMQHGTITVVFDHVGYEITSLRTDVETDGRHATVAYTRDWHVDLMRRDFTFNSMSMSFEGELQDPFQGLADLQAGVVRFVGDADARAREDFLRILRWFRFRGRFGMTMDDAAAKAVRTHARGLENISRERIWAEMSKILAGDHAVQLMTDMHDLGVAQWLDIESFSGAPWKNEFINAVHARTCNPITRLVSFHGFHACQVLKSWKASNAEMALVLFLCNHRGRNPFHLLAVQGVARSWAVELCVLNSAENGDDTFNQAILEAWDVPVFPVTGDDLIRLGMKPGPEFSPTIAHLKNVWADSDYTMNKAQLLHVVKVDLEAHM